jgi:uncharacterized membrane protein
MATSEVAVRSEPQFGAAEIGAIAHLYRGEMYRSKIWRTRLDATTNWAVVTSGIAMSVTFSSADASVLPIVLISFLVAVFLIFEARRYRYFDIWRTRVRIMEVSFYGPILRGQGVRTESGWNQVLADEYSGIYYHISFLEAAGRRLRRNYCWIFGVQVVSYWGKISIHPTPISSLDQLWQRASVGPLPGEVVLTAGSLFYLGLLTLGLLTLRGQRAFGRAHREPGSDDRLAALAQTEHY